MANTYFNAFFAIVVFVARSVEYANSTGMHFNGFNTERTFFGVPNQCTSVTFNIDILEGKSLTLAEMALTVTITEDVRIELTLNGTSWVRNLQAYDDQDSTSMTLTFNVLDELNWLVKSDNFTGELRFAKSVSTESGQGTIPLCSAALGVFYISRRWLFTESTEPADEVVELVHSQLQDFSNRTSDDVGTEVNCTRMSLLVDKSLLNEALDESGFTVLEPDMIDIGVCRGSCAGFLSQDKVHTQLLDYYSFKTGLNYVICCAPVEYSSLTILYEEREMEEGSLVYDVRTYDDIIVERCGCIYGV